jgi:non-ribosomal peptide synthetase component E (peptide arylation enzyme)
MTVFRNDNVHLDRTPALLHHEALDSGGRWSDRVAVLDAATGSAIGHAELADRARRFAAGLRARGARRGDVIALVAANGAAFPVAMHGALAAGLTLAPANPLLTARELGAFSAARPRSLPGRRRCIVCSCRRGRARPGAVCARIAPGGRAAGRRGR